MFSRSMGIISKLASKGKLYNVTEESKSSVRTKGACNYTDTSECRPRGPDGGWGWCVVLGCFLVYMFNAGLSSAIGILQAEIMKITAADVTPVSWIASLYNGFVYLIAPLTGPLTKTHGCRKLTMIGGCFACIGLFGACFSTSLPVYYISLGILPGCGMGLAFMPSLVIVGEYFDNRRPFAIGVALSGAGFGLIVFPMFVTYLLDTYNLQGTLMIMSGLALNCVLAGSFYFPLHPGICEGCKQQLWTLFKQLIDTAIIRDPKFILAFLSSVLILFAYTIPFSFLPLLAEESDISQEDSASLITTLGASSTLVRMGIGLVTTKFPKSRSSFFFLATCVAGASLLLTPLDRTFSYLAVSFAIFGATSGAVFSVFPDVLIYFFGAEMLPCTLGWVYLGHGIGGLIGPPIAGILVDCMGTNAVAFYLGGSVMLLASMLIFPTMLCSKQILKPDIEATIHNEALPTNFNHVISVNNSAVEVFTIS